MHERVVLDILLMFARCAASEVPSSALRFLRARSSGVPRRWSVDAPSYFVTSRLRRISSANEKLSVVPMRRACSHRPAPRSRRSSTPSTCARSTCRARARATSLETRQTVDLTNIVVPKPRRADQSRRRSRRRSRSRVPRPRRSPATSSRRRREHRKSPTTSAALPTPRPTPARRRPRFCRRRTSSRPKCCVRRSANSSGRCAPPGGAGTRVAPSVPTS